MVKNKLAISFLLLTAGSVPVQSYYQDMRNAMIVAGSVAAVGAIIAYTSCDSNETLLKRADNFLNQMDTFQDIFPPESWKGSQDAYFTYYLQHKFSLELSQTNESVSESLQEYFNQNLTYLSLARQCVEFRSPYFIAMKNKLSEIEELEILLQKASQALMKCHHDFLLVKQVKELEHFIRDTDPCQYIFPSSSFNGTLEAYFQSYLTHKFGIRLTSIHENSLENLRVYVEKNRSKVILAQELVDYLAVYCGEMKIEASQVAILKTMLSHADEILTFYYDDFFAAHQIINFYAKMPTNDAAWIEKINIADQIAKVDCIVRKGLFKDKKYPLLAYEEKIARDIKNIDIFLEDKNFVVSCPTLCSKLILCKKSIQYAYDLLLTTCAYQDEVVEQQKDNLLSSEQTFTTMGFQIEQASSSLKRVLQSTWASDIIINFKLRQSQALDESTRIAVLKNESDAQRNR